MSSYSFWAFAGLFMLAGYALATTHTSDGDSGELCGADPDKQYNCLDGKASCVDDECKCHNPPYAYGDGRWNCYKNNTFRTEITNDPDIMTYNNRKLALPIPCRYFLTHTKTWLKNKNRDRVGFCYFEAYAFHKKDKGKIYVGGYDVAISLMYDNGTVIDMSFRKYGHADDGDYTYNIEDIWDYNPHGPWNEADIDFHDPDTNLKITCNIDDINNLAILHAKKCGIRIQFRPYDKELRINQTQIPHVSYEANCAFHPEFLSSDKVVAIPPVAHGGQTIDTIAAGLGLSAEQAIIYRAFASMAVQNTPKDCGNPECALAQGKLDTCGDMSDAFDNCLWIFQLPRFIRCMDDTDSGVDIMSLFNECVDVQCNGGNCGNLISKITGKGCHVINNPYTEVTYFINNGCTQA